MIPQNCLADEYLTASSDSFFSDSELTPSGVQTQSQTRKTHLELLGSIFICSVTDQTLLGQRFDIRAYTNLRVLATVKWSDPDFLVGIGDHATMLIDRQNDMSRWKYRQVSISSGTFPSSFWLQKVDEGISFKESGK